MTVSQPEVPPALRYSSSWPGDRWAFVTCWWKERESDQESPHGACGSCWLGPWLLVCFCVLLLHFKNTYLLYLLFIYWVASDLSCGRWDLVPWPVIQPGVPCLGSTESWPLDHQGSCSLLIFNLRIISPEEISIYLPIRREHRGNGFRVHSEWQVKT